MRILSWNVNGIRAVQKRGFAQWLTEDSPDILCLQETKARPDQLDEELLNVKNKAGKLYKTFWASAKKAGYAGTAIYTLRKPLDVTPLGIDAFDDEGRVLQAEFDNFTLICAYFPNSQDAGARLPYKLDFCAALLERCNAMAARGRHFVLCGDYNIAHTPIDLARPKDNEDHAGYLPEERAWMDAYTAAGHVDTFRHFHPGEKGHYSWWSYRPGVRERNVGWRLDYHCVDSAFMPQVKAASIRNEVYGSDHCPVQIEIKV